MGACRGLSTITSPWPRRRLGIGDLLAALGNDCPGVGLRPDGLPDIDWIDIAPGPFTWQEGETRTIDERYRVGRYPVTNAQYQAFIDVPDYGDARWWREGYAAPPPNDPRWQQPNRPRVNVAWVEAMAFWRWLTARYRAAGAFPYRAAGAPPHRARAGARRPGGRRARVPLGQGLPARLRERRRDRGRRPIWPLVCRASRTGACRPSPSS